MKPLSSHDNTNLSSQSNRLKPHKTLVLFWLNQDLIRKLGWRQQNSCVYLLQ
ncbi:hypothetical protein [Shimia sagamensis]|uniref:hypothetical protein n=1 Tax=Shimia sagamensis TaxID=1566352 RepID=UPI0024B778E8|nr:hypothetical protein [Shimia sagamensis]